MLLTMKSLKTTSDHSLNISLNQNEIKYGRTASYYEFVLNAKFTAYRCARFKMLNVDPLKIQNSLSCDLGYMQESLCCNYNRL